MKVILKFIFLIVSLLSMVEAGRYDKNRKMGIRSGKIRLDKWNAIQQDKNFAENGMTIREAKMGIIKKYSDLPDIQDYDNT